MSLPRKIRHTSKRVIDGVGYDIHAISEMEYTGHWNETGYDVFCDGKFIANFYAWPTDGDIRNSLTNQKSIVG